MPRTALDVLEFDKLRELLRLRIRNRQGEREIHWNLGRTETVEFVVRDVENVTGPQKARRAAWLKGEAQVAGDPHR
jgi:hypothetical protein